MQSVQCVHGLDVRCNCGAGSRCGRVGRLPSASLRSYDGSLDGSNRHKKISQRFFSRQYRSNSTFLRNEDIFWTLILFHLSGEVLERRPAKRRL